MNRIWISASRLGEILLPDACERCCWLKLRVNHRLPFDVFPSIFNSIDSSTKDTVNSWFDVHGMPPPWLSQLGSITGYQKPKPWREFQTTDHEYGIHLTGAADAIFEYADGSYLIADYKTARVDDDENKKLMPRYAVQLNAYARIARDCGPAPISRLALIYLEPAQGHADNCREDGLVMGFQARVVDVPLDNGLLGQAMARTRALFDRTDAPDGAPECKDCDRIRELAEHLWPGFNWSEIDSVDPVDGTGQRGLIRRFRAQTFWPSKKLVRSEIDPAADRKHYLYNRVVVFTGNFRMGKQALWDECCRIGATPDLNVTKRTNVVVVGDIDPTVLRPGATLTEKAQRAHELQAKGQDIVIMTEDKFLRCLSGKPWTPTPPTAAPIAPPQNASRPTRTSPARRADAAPQSTQMETLICFNCGKHWQRPRSHGRRPGRCPACAAHG